MIEKAKEGKKYFISEEIEGVRLKTDEEYFNVRTIFMKDTKEFCLEN